MTREQLNTQIRDLDCLMLCNQQLYTHLDIDCQRIMDELAVMKDDLDQLCNEAANLQVERKWPTFRE